jgi:uncharacterized membrane protein YdjX (TVP38/TMEM64 family)
MPSATLKSQIIEKVTKKRYNKSMSDKKLIKYLRLIVAILWGAVLFAGIAWVTFYLLKYGFAAGKEEIRDAIINANEWKCTMFLLIFSLRGLFFIPPLFLVIIAGFIFEPVEALVLSLAGQVISSILLYFVASFIGRKIIMSSKNKILKKMDKMLSEKGFFATILLFLIPFVPADSVTIVAAITGISFADYLLGMLFGSIGIFFPFVFLKGSLNSIESFLWMILPFFALLLVTVWAWKHPRYNDFFGKKKKKLK